jgi:SAM-dependent methyltransferase
MGIESYLPGSFGRAAPEHFAWQTASAYVSECEQSLVRSAFFPLRDRVLDVGCGEGATLWHLGEPEGATGVDLFEEKVAHARAALPRCRFVVGSAYKLPFPDAAFDQVIVRDLIHHLERPEIFVRECARVLVPGGRFDALETCGNNPLIVAQSLLVPVERGQLRSREGYLRRLFAPEFTITSTEHHQALPVHRALFHPDMGSPSLANSGAVRRLVRAVEGAAEKLMPRAFWAYVSVRSEKRASS